MNKIYVNHKMKKKTIEIQLPWIIVSWMFLV